MAIHNLLILAGVLKCLTIIVGVFIANLISRKRSHSRHVDRSRKFDFRKIYIFFGFVAIVIVAFNTYTASLHGGSKRNKRHRNQTNAVDVFIEHVITNSTVYAKGQTCKHPVLNPYDPDILALLGPTENQTSKVCGFQDWVYVDNGTVRISENALEKYGNITCSYIPLITKGLGNEVIKRGKPITPLVSGLSMTTDLFLAECKSSNGTSYRQIHSGIAYNAALHRSSDKPPSSQDGFNIFVLCISSLSHMAYKRSFPITRHYFKNSLHGLEYNGYNAVGDGAFPQILALLAGVTEAGFPSTWRGQPKSESMDVYPWILKDFKQAGHITAWGEDLHESESFRYRRNGFLRELVDHSLWTHQLKSSNSDQNLTTPCIGSMPGYKRMLLWLKDVYKMYTRKRIFVLGFLSAHRHRKKVQLSELDTSIAEYLQELETNGYLDKTILILLSDHGDRHASMRDTEHGKFEERLPLFSIHFPQAFLNKNPNVAKNLENNALRLTTPFDVHETLYDILLNSYYAVDHGIGHRRAVSLLKEIPKTRTCTDAGIGSHWCACLVHESAELAMGVSAAQFVIRRLNRITSPQRQRCAWLSYHKLRNVTRVRPNDHVLKFGADENKQTKSAQPWTPKQTKSAQPWTPMYEYLHLTFQTVPGLGLFEATVKHQVGLNEFEVSFHQINRISPYGAAARCIERDFPHMKSVCYCR